MSIEKINHYSLTTPASVHDEEALTALELAGRTAAKVNQCVDEVNRIPEVVSEDVLEHITSGDFDKQIGKYAGDLDHRVNVILGGLPENPTAMDAEIIDMRLGADGVTYENAGNALRGQIGKTLVMRGLIDNVDALPDVNAITDAGVHILHFSEGATDIPAGLPFAAWTGRIGALFTVKNTYHRQVFINDKHIYTRTAGASGSWGEWSILNEITQNGDVNDDNYQTLLPNANDAKNGFYSLHFAAGAIRTKNLPFNKWRGRVAMLLTTENNYKRQLLISNNYIYTRYQANGQWSEWSNLIGKETYIVSNNLVLPADYRSLTKAIMENPNARIIVRTGTYDVWNEYVNEYGSTFFSEYTGYEGAVAFARGLYLSPYTELIGEGNVTLYFENRLPSNTAIAQYFSVLAPTQNNRVENINIEIADGSCRYHIHDDFALYGGVNVFRNMHFKGYSHLGTVIGGGFGTANTYVIENCIFEDIGETIAIAYHNNVADGQNRLYINGCYCEGSIDLKHYGVSEKMSTALISGSHYTKLQLRHGDASAYPNENIKVFEVKGGSSVDTGVVDELVTKTTDLENRVTELENAEYWQMQSELHKREYFDTDGQQLWGAFFTNVEGTYQVAIKNKHGDMVSDIVVTNFYQGLTNDTISDIGVQLEGGNNVYFLINSAFDAANNQVGFVIAVLYDDYEEGTYSIPYKDAENIWNIVCRII